MLANFTRMVIRGKIPTHYYQSTYAERVDSESIVGKF